MKRNWEYALKNDDKELAKELNGYIRELTVGKKEKNDIDWDLLAEKIGYAHMSLFDSGGIMRSHARRVFVELAILSKFGKSFYGNMVKIANQ